MKKMTHKAHLEALKLISHLINNDQLQSAIECKKNGLYDEHLRLSSSAFNLLDQSGSYMESYIAHSVYEKDSCFDSISKALAFSVLTNEQASQYSKLLAEANYFSSAFRVGISPLNFSMEDFVVSAEEKRLEALRLLSAIAKEHELEYA